MTAPLHGDPTLVKLIDHCTWANDAWLDFIAHHFHADEFLMKRIAHIFAGERAWFQRLAGTEPDRQLWRLMTIPELRDLQHRHRIAYDDVLKGDLNRVIAYKRFTGEEYASPVGDIVLHLALHGAHHRGQMATHVSATGTMPINTDFVQYCLMNRV